MQANERLNSIRDRLGAITPGPWQAATAPSEASSETKAEYLTAALLNGDEPLWVVWAANPTDDDFDYVVPAVTGDGPTSRANAEFIASAVDDIAYLLSLVEVV